MPRALADDAVIARLATAREGEDAFLEPHHLAAAQRLEAMVRRAQLAPRLTMSYDPAARGGRRGAGNAVETASDSAADARQKLNALAGKLPPDCWGVVFDICGLGKGLQVVETERRWPRRSAKLVLRIALEQVATLFGLSPHAQGRTASTTRVWLEERLPLIADTEP